MAEANNAGGDMYRDTRGVVICSATVALPVTR